MRSIKGLLYFVSALVAVSFGSCDKDDSPVGPEENEPGVELVAGSVSASAFTVSISGTFSGLSKVDLALGKKGILYCVGSDNAEAIFKSWQEGKDNSECLVFQSGKLEGESYKGTIMNLYPDTEYSFCMFCQKQDESRVISAVSSFRTLELNPRFNNPRADSVRYYYAAIKGSAEIDSRDASYCKGGLLLSTKENGSLGDTACIFSESGNIRSLRSEVYEKLLPARNYYLRAYVSYKMADGNDQIIYGPEIMFTTGSLDDYGVDLGLPSGIKWSKCEMGRQEFENGFDYHRLNPYYVYWGSVNPSYYGEGYEFWDAENESYINIGNDIAGTQYDVAHVILGGKWRMPTKADFEELIAYCTIGKPRHTTYVYRAENYSMSTSTQSAIITGPNGNYIKSRTRSCWTATMSEDGIHPYTAHYIYDNDKDSASIELYNEYDRDFTFMIRPVWDPNM